MVSGMHNYRGKLIKPGTADVQRGLGWRGNVYSVKMKS